MELLNSEVIDQSGGEEKLRDIRFMEKHSENIFLKIKKQANKYTTKPFKNTTATYLLFYFST